ncbi:glycoside hydrolase family 3 C-terminal domain-containing protein [Mucilaginibacter mali]|uniref:Glycoside hydrolase family 3 C-terminal domain-containing protein n=1 Tax=Mucilaginibacter mali TaxID=2740462 RepID=A0A7D4Q8K7_9SPHI|nr:glycoside hydrolase family 3 C-terminal domain-containing protein [Mucilaginibacter mali]QKJ28924.1 glycoside hydrolase family 3 C-terminal domain-containing protein [Mucilaginibacter mali]
MKSVARYLLFLAAACIARGATAQKLPFKDPKLSFDKRADDLVSRLTLEEKVGQMIDQAKSIPRLGIPEYNWWNECLHGVARAGLATVFPMPIGTAASFDSKLISDIGNATSDEARAKYHEFLRNGKHGRYQGLTFWSPNINIFRDPRWGRGMETYGEDPFLTSVMGVNFVKGLQGDDPHYLKLVATPKHYMVHSGPELERHQFNATTDKYDFYDTYLPAFKATVQKGKAVSIMSAYNAYDGEPAPASVFLLDKVLRTELGFNGYVVSDCDAIYDVYAFHKKAGSKAEASAKSVIAGTDLDCGPTYLTLLDAVKAGMITEKQIDVSLKRLFMARLRLGMFDADKLVKYASIPYSVVNSHANQKLALDAARKSIVLLKNEHDILPLSKNIKTLAVIGPNADAKEVQWGNYNGIPTDEVNITPLQGLRTKLPNAQIIYAPGCELAEFDKGADTAKAKQNFTAAMAAAQQADAVVLCMGLTPKLEGEEMKVQAKGFSGGDRVSIDLPKPQEDLIKAIYKTGKPVVLVLLNGSALSINWEKENLPAIVESWYGGQAAGTAIADVLFGDYNPAGRLPVTFYKSVNDLPDFHDYSMSNRTYRYFKGDVAYAFGYGLSYTTFKYSGIAAPAELAKGKNITVSVNVTNTGKMAGDEVAELYVRHLSDVRKPIHALKGFKRIHLKAGETQAITFTLTSDQLMLVDKTDKWSQETGKIQLFIGGSQPGEKNATTGNVVSKIVNVR